MSKLAIIGGTGLGNNLSFGSGQEDRITARYRWHRCRIDSGYDVVRYENGRVVYVNRHKVALYPSLEYAHPDEIDFRRLMTGLFQDGVTHVVSTSAVGCTNLDYKPGTIVVPDDYIDFLNPDCSVEAEGHDGKPYIDMSVPFDPDLRKSVVRSLERVTGEDVVDQGLYFRMKSGRFFETPAEIKWAMQTLPDDTLYLGMTVPTEAVLARYFEIPYATVCVVTNPAAGLVPETEIDHEENSRAFEASVPVLNKMFQELVNSL